MDTSLWMARDLLTVTPPTPLDIAGRSMAKRQVRHLLVVEREGSDRLVGLVSSHDLFLAADAGIHPFSPRAVESTTMTVADIMIADPCSIAPTTSITEAACILRDKKFGCLPVVDRGALVGILTEHDILRAFLRLSGADQPGYEVTCIVLDARDVLGEMHGIAAGYGLQIVSTNVFHHEGKRYGIVRFIGTRNDSFVDALWNCGHTILRVRQTTSGTDGVVGRPEPHTSKRS